MMKFQNHPGMFSGWWFPKIGVPQNGWFITENPIKMDDFGGYRVPLLFGNTYFSISAHTSSFVAVHIWWMMCGFCLNIMIAVFIGIL